MFENLSGKLERAFKVLKGQGQITEINVAETLKEVRKALIDADVNYKIAKDFTVSVKEKALGMNVLTAVSPGQLLVKITNDHLKDLMGGDTSEINIEIASDGEECFISIEDNGLGIPEKNYEDVFKPFFTLDPSRNKLKGESGLGMTITRDIIRSHGGEIKLLKSKIGGLKTLISLPL